MCEKLIERLREYPDREETAGGYVEVDWQDLLDAADVIESLTAQLAALQTENAEKDREIARLSEQLEADSQLKSGLSNANALCSMYKATLSRVEAERDAAKKCIYDIETYLAFGSVQYIDRTIQAWQSGAQGEG